MVIYVNLQSAALFPHARPHGRSLMNDFDEKDNLQDTGDQPTLPRTLGKIRRHLGATIGVTVALIVVGVASFNVGTHFGPARESASTHVETDWPTKDYGTTPSRTCDVPPAPVETPKPEASTDLPPKTMPPTEPCTAPRPDIVILLTPAKAKALPANVGSIDCGASDGYETEYSACGPRPFKDVESIAKSVLTPEQLAFVNDHVLASQDALWAFDVQDAATLKGQYMASGASYDKDSETITLYVW
jgi:hypothetical protein